MGVDTCTGSYCFDPALTEWNTGSKQEMSVPRFALSASGVGLARDRKGRRPHKVTPAKLRPGMASMCKHGTKVGKPCRELGVTRQTLCRHVSPAGQLRPDGLKVISRS